MMLSPEERARVERTARLQAELTFWQTALKDNTATWDGSAYVIRQPHLTRDDKTFLRQIHISPE
jgi:hypothetical protein